MWKRSPLRPIRMEEVIEPAVIKKNAVISMRYSMNGMMLSTSGQAMEDGALGIDMNDDIVGPACVAHDGRAVNARVAAALAGK